MKVSSIRKSRYFISLKIPLISRATLIMYHEITNFKCIWSRTQYDPSATLKEKSY